MNREAVQNEINSIIEASHKALGKFASKQYPVGKAQLATLTELGIIEFMPNAPYSRTIGHSDAKAVIAAAQDSGKSVSTDALSDDPATYPASKLYTLLNEVDEAEVTEHVVTMDTEDEHGIGDLSIRIQIGQTAATERAVSVYGWRNDNEEINEVDVFGDYEVEIATIEMSDADFAAFEKDTRHAPTFTLTQQQVDDALKLFDSIYMSNES